MDVAAALDRFPKTACRGWFDVYLWRKVIHPVWLPANVYGGQSLKKKTETWKGKMLKSYKTKTNPTMRAYFGSFYINAANYDFE